MAFRPFCYRSRVESHNYFKTDIRLDSEGTIFEHNVIVDSVKGTYKKMLRHANKLDAFGALNLKNGLQRTKNRYVTKAARSGKMRLTFDNSLMISLIRPSYRDKLETV